MVLSGVLLSGLKLGTGSGLANSQVANSDKKISKMQHFPLTDVELIRILFSDEESSSAKVPNSTKVAYVSGAKLRNGYRRSAPGNRRLTGSFTHRRR